MIETYPFENFFDLILNWTRVSVSFDLSVQTWNSFIDFLSEWVKDGFFVTHVAEL